MRPLHPTHRLGGGEGETPYDWSAPLQSSIEPKEWSHDWLMTQIYLDKETDKTNAVLAEAEAMLSEAAPYLEVAPRPDEEVWMLSSKYRSAISRTHQSYITRSMLPCVTLTGTTLDQVMAIDSDSTLQLAAGELLQNIRMIKPSAVATIAGTMAFTSVGDLMIPHHICGSTILEAVKVKDDQLPTGCNAMLGRAGINACQLDVTRLGRAPPSIVPRAIFSFDPVPQTAVFDHEVRDKFGKWHLVCWDGVVDERCGKRAFVLFKDGSTSLVRFTHIRDAKTKSPPNRLRRCPRCVLSSCNEPVLQGLCPKFCGRRTACSLEHY